MDNIYEKLEIKDYNSLKDFIDEVQDRFTLCGQYDSVVIYGTKEFVHKCMILFAQLYDFKVAYAELYNVDDGFYKGEFLLEIEYQDIQDDIVMQAQAARYNDGIDGYEKFANINIGYDYTRVFINQDGVKQDLVDKCLKNDNEVMLFGVQCNEYIDDDVVICDEHCPWWEECETDNNIE